MNFNNVLSAINNWVILLEFVIFLNSITFYLQAKQATN